MIRILRIILRILTIAALTVCSYRAVTKPITASAPVIVLADRSDSITQYEIGQLIKKADKLLGSFPQIRLNFAGKSVIEESALEVVNYSKLRTQESNLEEAILKAGNLNPSAILLLSDGLENAGSAEHSIEVVSELGLPIYALTPDRLNQEQDSKLSAPSITQLSAPLIAALGKSVAVNTTIYNPKDFAVAVNLTVYQDKKILLQRLVTLAAKQEQLVSVESDPSFSGVSEIRSTISLASDPKVISELTSFLSGEKREKVLLLSGTPEDQGYLKKALEAESFQVEGQVSSPSLSIKLDDFSAVILSNTSLTQLPTGLVSKITKFVEDGRGLLVIGGPRAFGLGGYIGSAVESILPVLLVPPQAEKKRLDLAVELVIDKSQSMAANDKIEFAKEAARQVIRSLKPEDYIGIIGFDQFPWIAVPIAQVATVREYALKQIEDLYPTRTTQMYSAIAEAAQQLQRIRAGRKHAIIMTDGKISDAGPFYESLIREMRMSGITVSSVLLGDPSQGAFLRHLSDLGGGAYYQTQDPNALPKIFMSDVTTVSGERTMKESAQVSVEKGPDSLYSTTLLNFPTLRGYVETRRKPDAKLELVTKSESERNPLLASNKIGAGRVVAFTSDASSRWAANWVAWPYFNQFWGEVVSSTLGIKRDRRRLPEFEVRTSVEKANQVVDLFVFGKLENSDLLLEIRDPRGEIKLENFKTIEPGHLQVKSQLTGSGKYSATIFESIAGDNKADDAGVKLPEFAWLVDDSLVQNEARLTPNFSLLSRITELTGGKLNPTEQEFVVPEKKINTPTQFDRNLALLAAFLFFAEVFLRGRRVV